MPVLLKDSCQTENKITAKALEDYNHDEGRTNFVRVQLGNLEGDLYFEPTEMQESGMSTSKVQADGIAVFPENKGIIEKESNVEIFVLKEF